HNLQSRGHRSTGTEALPRRCHTISTCESSSPAPPPVEVGAGDKRAECAQATSGPRSLLTATSARQGNGTLPGSSARDYLHLGGGSAGGRDEHLASGVGVTSRIGGHRHAV